jgi:hypothetical protein
MSVHSKIIEKCQLGGIISIAPKADLTHEFREHVDLLLKRTVWNEKCRSRFKKGTIDGLPRLCLGSWAHMFQLMDPRYEDFVITYDSDNRFRFMGNGVSMRDLDGGDATWYLGIVDGEDKQPDFTQRMKSMSLNYLMLTLSLHMMMSVLSKRLESQIDGS